MSGPRVTLYRNLPAEGWPSMERYADGLAAALRQAGLPVRQFPLRTPAARGRALRYASRYLWYPLRARAAQSAVSHVLDHSYAHLLWALDARRTVVTVHDLAPLAGSGADRDLGIARLLWRLGLRALGRAERLVSVSGFTAEELRRRLGLPSEVISPGIEARWGEPVAAEQVEEVERRYGLPEVPWLLHVGSAEPRKDLPTLLEALALARRRHPGLVLVQAGGRPGRTLRQRATRLGVEGAVRWLGHVPEDDLHALYHRAAVFVFPSLYEGFGFPVLEAMSAGTPVVCSRAGALPEVAGAAALLVEPKTPERLAQAVEELLADEPLRQRLSAASRERAREFSWAVTAGRLVRVYRELAGG